MGARVMGRVVKVPPATSDAGLFVARQPKVSAFLADTVLLSAGLAASQRRADKRTTQGESSVEDEFGFEADSVEDEDDDWEDEELYHRGLRELLQNETLSARKEHSSMHQQQGSNGTLIVWPWFDGLASMQFVLSASTGSFEVLSATHPVITAAYGEGALRRGTDSNEEDPSASYSVICEGKMVVTAKSVDAVAVSPVIWHGPLSPNDLASLPRFAIGVASGRQVVRLQLNFADAPGKSEL